LAETPELLQMLRKQAIGDPTEPQPRLPPTTGKARPPERRRVASALRGRLLVAKQLLIRADRGGFRSPRSVFESRRRRKSIGSA